MMVFHLNTNVHNKLKTRTESTGQQTKTKNSKLYILSSSSDGNQ